MFYSFPGDTTVFMFYNCSIFRKNGEFLFPELLVSSCVKV